jgi:hypothetical protein
MENPMHIIAVNRHALLTPEGTSKVEDFRLKTSRLYYAGEHQVENVQLIIGFMTFTGACVSTQFHFGHVNKDSCDILASLLDRHEVPYTRLEI